MRSKPHTDGGFVDEQRGTTFVYTTLLYLNDVEHGGATAFYDARYGDDGKLVYSLAKSPRPVRCRTGQGLAFFHKTPHGGETVGAGIKYVLRLDLMYRPVA